MKPIKRCPFCGSDAPSLNCRYISQYHKFIVFVKCDACGAQSGVVGSLDHPSKDDWEGHNCEVAVDKWNRRVGE